MAVGVGVAVAVVVAVAVGVGVGWAAAGIMTARENTPSIRAKNRATTAIFFTATP